MSEGDQEEVRKLERQLKNRFPIGSHVSEQRIIQDFLKQVCMCSSLPPSLPPSLPSSLPPSPSPPSPLPLPLLLFSLPSLSLSPYVLGQSQDVQWKHTCIKVCCLVGNIPKHNAGLNFIRTSNLVHRCLF